MTFKWTYIAALILAIAAIAVTAIGVGFLGIAAHLWAIGLAALGGLFVFWGFMGRVPTSVGRTDEEFVGYPKNQVMAVFDTRAAAANALNDLRRSGFQQDDLSVFSGEQGQKQLDSEGDSHGFTQVAQRSIEHLVADIDDLKGYEESVREGGIVLGVLVPEEERREHVLDVFQRHHAHDVYYFGELAVQRLDVDRTRTRVD